jgi:excisionase family DNA binding protein
MGAIQPLLYSTRDAAKRLGVGRNKLLALLKAKRIRAVDIDGRLKFTDESLSAFIAASPDALDSERAAP